ncbi:MAG TPA: hypothetical protein VHY32_07820 [Caulobacteraceae bacterium]|jgi:hypothetical protein|nr:hypothetical protein [Caulobacteraceae bacterium]
MKRVGAVAWLLFFAVQFSLTTGLQAMATETATLPAGTRLYLILDENVSSARGGDDVGTIVRCRVWRDVEAHGVVYFKSGTPANCRVDKVSRRNIGGFEGKVSVAGVDTKSADDQTVMLAGGYNKEGSGHKAVVLTVGLLLLWPVLFVPGGNAELPPGTVFDVSTVNDLRIDVGTLADAPAVVDLRNMAGSLSAEFMLDDFISQPKHDVFRIKVAKDGQLPDKLFIDSVNGKPVDAIALMVKGATSKDGKSSGVIEVSSKLLAKYFARGINHFDVAYTEDGQRQATEVIMDVQM